MSEVTAKEIKAPPAMAGEASCVSQQDRPSLEALYRRYWRELLAYVATNFGSGPPEPEDVVQSAFTKLAHQNMAKIKNPRAFLYTTARNVVIDFRRKAARHRAHAEATSSLNVFANMSEIDGERVLLGKEEIAVMMQTLHRLPRAQRRMFLLSRLHDMSFEEIARQEGTTPGAVRKKVSRAMAKCAMALQRAGKIELEADQS